MATLEDLDRRVDAMHRVIAESEVRLKAEVTATELRLGSKISQTEQRLEAATQRLSDRISATERRFTDLLNERFDQIMAALDRPRNLPD